jgi:uncharacterized protein YigA (DUF484 family)
MSKQTVRDVEIASVPEDTIADYLKAHPDFFQHHASLLSLMHIPHERGGSSVSLVERQVQVLREKNEKLERKLRELIEVARINDVLAEKIHRLVRRLVRAQGAVQLLEALETSLREDFDASHWRLVLTRTDVPGLDRLANRFLLIADRDSPQLRMFETFFESARPRCGQIRDSQRDFLFGEGTVEIGSAALVPLGPQGAFGILAIGSHDAERFHPTMSTDFLARIGDLVGEAVGAL